jgi:ribonuclease P protein component
VRDQKFPSVHRLAKPRDYSEVFETSKRISDRYFIILYKPNGLGIARLGTVVSKKSIRLATTRNRIKRIIREGFRRHKELLAGHDLVVMVKKNFELTNSGVMSLAINNILTKVKRA